VTFIHKNDLAHRDIKLENIFLSDKFVPKIGDFGLSKKFKKGSKMSTWCGTEGYMAPEIESQNYAGPPVDIFALGVVLFLMITGKAPFNNTGGPYHKMMFVDPVGYL
jgi:serine/threonine protein kinase KIN1/2